MSKTRKIFFIIFIVALSGIAYYGISPLFNDIEVQEALPENVIDDANSPASDITRTVEVMGTAGHPASGSVRLLSTSEGRVIRYENFSTINGPNLHVYLAKDLDAKEYIDLGPIKGTEGNINYSVPEDTNLSEYRYVMYWCVPFGVLFNYADLGV